MISYIFDLIVYISLFGFSYMFIIMSRRYERTINLYLIIAGLVLCLFATFRSYDVGTDTINYLNFYNLAGEKSFFDLIKMSTFSEIEIGFDFLIWLTANVFHSYRILLFISAFLTVIPIYTVIQKLETRSAAFLASLTFFFLFWGMTLNVTRQGIASAFFLLAVVLWDEKKRSKAILTIVVACLFHYGAIFGIVMIIVPYLTTKIKNVHNQNLFFAVALIVLCVLASAWDVILLRVLGNTSGVLYSYTKYVAKFQGGYTYLSNVSIDHYIDLIIRIILVILPIIFLKGYTQPLFTRNNNINSNYGNKMLHQERRMIYLSIEALFIDAFCLLVIGTMYGYRIVMCADFMLILSYANVAQIKGYPKSASLGIVNLDILIITCTIIGSFFIRYIWLHMHGIAGLLEKCFEVIRCAK